MVECTGLENRHGCKPIQGSNPCLSATYGKLLKMLRLLVLIFCFTAAPYSYAQDTYQNSIPKKIIKSDDRFLTFTSENDLYGSGKDEHYTNGARVTYYDSSAKSPKFVETFEKYIPFFSANETTSVYYSLGQNLYTPEVITARNPDPDDRPYAGFLYGSVGVNTVIDNHVDELEVTLGVVGPLSLGEETQKFVHRTFDFTKPEGWDSQLDNEPALIVALQRMWPEAYSMDLDPLFVRVSPHVGASVGNVYTHANSGFTVQLTPKKYKWQSTPIRVRPALPGSGYFSVPDNIFAWSLFAGVDGRAVARNIFLDGNSFSGGPSVDKKPLVADVSGGVTLTYGRVQTAYTLNWRSDEFYGQSDNSMFGAISVGYRF